jgi:hypothetical protein
VSRGWKITVVVVAVALTVSTPFSWLLDKPDTGQLVAASVQGATGIAAVLWGMLQPPAASVVGTDIPPERLPVGNRRKTALIGAALISAAVLAVTGGITYVVYPAEGSSSTMPGCTDVKKEGVRWSAICTTEHGNDGAKTICSDGTTVLGPQVSSGRWQFGGDCSGHGRITWRGTYWTR